MDIIAGAAACFAPPQIQAGIGAATIALNLLNRFRLRRKRASALESDASLHPIEGVTLEWSQVTCTLTGKDGSSRVLLDGLHGRARPGRILVIFGPSGSGKTTLLNTIAGQLPYSKSLGLEGYITANGRKMPSSKFKTGFVAQEDLFFSQLTVRETLTMAAELRAKESSTAEERSEVVESVIRRLGLSKCSDTVIGDAKTRGLSGGEKKRLAIACEMISRPQMIMADEPTSGLDAFGAQQAVRALKDLASEGNTVIMSIHQPRSSIFDMLDDICLLSEGRLIYFGPREDVLPYFRKLGHACPAHFNPAEFLADLVAVDHTSEETERASAARIEELAAAFRAASPAPAASSLPLDVPGRSGEEGAAGDGVGLHPGCSLPRQVALLLGRSWKQIRRDKATLVSRASSQLSSAIVFSAIYWKLGMKQSDIQSRLGLIQVSCIGTAMTSLIKTLNVFPSERTIVQRERSRAAYPVISYFASKLAAELPIGALFPAIFGAVVYPCTGLAPDAKKFASFLSILVAESFAAQALGLTVGAVAPSTSAALAIGPAVMLVSIVFGGLFVNVDGVPKPLRWIPKTSLIKHAFEGACINELTGLEFDCGSDRQGRPRTKRGEDVLADLGAGGDTVRDTFVNQGRVICAWWWMAYRIIEKRRPKYVEVKAPRPTAA